MLNVGKHQVYSSALQADMSMATQLLSAVLTVLLEGLKGESQDEVRPRALSLSRAVRFGSWSGRRARQFFLKGLGDPQDELSPG